MRMWEKASNSHKMQLIGMIFSIQGKNEIVPLHLKKTAMNSDIDSSILSLINKMFQNELYVIFNDLLTLTI